jgi:Flp pilus assembly protein TadB
MKLKLPHFFYAILLMASCFTASASSDKNSISDKISGMTQEQKEQRAAEIQQRVQEIKDMDKSTLSKADRKALKEELRNMRKEARVIRGVYISVAGIIIIILVLIIIL